VVVSKTLHNSLKLPSLRQQYKMAAVLDQVRVSSRRIINTVRNC